MQTNFRELVLCESKRRPNFTQNEGIGSDLGQMKIPRRNGVTLMYFKWEDGCIYSKGSSHAAGHQSTDKLDVKCGWQICNWHRLSNQPIQPLLVFPTHRPKSSLVRKFAQFCRNLPSHRHFMAWCPRELPSCCMAGNMWCSACGCSLGAQGMKELLLPGTHSSWESSAILNAEGNLPAHAFLCSTFHINPICTWVPALQLVWKVRDSLAYHLL